MVSLVAGGNGRLSGNKGVAYNCDFIFVDYLSGAGTPACLIDAINYIFTKADSLGKACVVNISSSYWLLANTDLSLESKAINQLMENTRGKIITVCSGNDGESNIHSEINFLKDTMWLYFSPTANHFLGKVRISDKDKEKISFGISWDSVALIDFCVDGSEPISIDSRNSKVLSKSNKWYGYKDIIEAMYDSVNLHYDYIDKDFAVLETLVYEEDTIKIYGFTERFEEGYWYYYFLLSYNMNSFDPNFYRLARLMIKKEGIIDATDKIYFWGNGKLPVDISGDLHYINSDYEYQLYFPAFCKNVVTVGAYVNKSMNYFNRYYLRQGEPAPFSSHGPNLEGVIKPDVIAPGANILVSLIDENGEIKSNYISGTSFSSPVVAGIIALYLEKNRNASYDEILYDIRSTTIRDGYTTYFPNNVTGFGKVDALRFLVHKFMDNRENNKINNSKIDVISNNPNPFCSNTVIEYEISESGKISIEIYNILGHKIKDLYKAFSQRGSHEILWDGRSEDGKKIGSGIYFCKLRTANGKVLIKKMVCIK